MQLWNFTVAMLICLFLTTNESQGKRLYFYLRNPKAVDKRDVENSDTRASNIMPGIRWGAELEPVLIRRFRSMDTPRIIDDAYSSDYNYHVHGQAGCLGVPFLLAGLTRVGKQEIEMHIEDPDSDQPAEIAIPVE
ncbi:hypothetical protein L9F63_021956 [Diploptera punctata]|uniref:Uncharacterized protein n=1 Tax=Diploptera punctata TaxID=6984 RepID=A0AAD7ZNH8_DIPPU|nr:hypothetical protein L9F63_021956 [Diploptera punctata]